MFLCIRIQFCSPLLLHSLFPLPSPLTPSVLPLFFLCSTILSVSGVSTRQAVVTDIVSSPDAVWVGTQGGHLIAFNPISTDVVLVHQRQSSISCIVSLDTQQHLVTFGLAEVEGEEDGDTLGTFTVWTSFVRVDQ